ncbi:MAG: hypothetical protein R3C45_11000 [Phycisphaerales bacterium]
MRSTLRRHIPSMFHRRLLLLAGSAVVVTCILGAQTVRLSVGAEHARRKAAAERALQESHPIPTVRGKVLDRYDRPLALDEPGYEVAVNYRLISGEWAYQQARAAAKESDPDRWKEIDSAEQNRLTDERLPEFEAKAGEMWDLLAEMSGADPLELTRRKDVIRRQVQRVISSQTLRNREKREADYDEPVSWAEAREKVMEETWAHTVLNDIPDNTRISILGFITGAETDPNLAAWKEVEVRQPQRRYPNETFTVSVDRSTLPSPLRHEEPIQVTVHGVGLHHLGLLRGIWASDDGIEPYG